MIRHYAQRVAEALALVYRRWPYSLLTVLVVFIIFSVNVLLPNYRVISSARIVFLLLAGAPVTMAAASFAMLVIMSLLSGIVASMAVFAIRRQLHAATGASSILLSFIAPSCPSCAIGLAGLFGLGGLIGALPFAGVELGVLGIIALLVSIFYLSKKITATTCSLEKNHSKTNPPGMRAHVLVFLYATCYLVAFFIFIYFHHNNHGERASKKS